MRGWGRRDRIGFEIKRSLPSGRAVSAISISRFFIYSESSPNIQVLGAIVWREVIK